MDGFAGPGEYLGGEPGSPVIVIDAARAHSQRPSRRVTFGFIEKDRARAEHLERTLATRFPPGALPKNWKYFVENDEFEASFDRSIGELKRRGSVLLPTFAFLDPFGFTGFPMRCIQQLLGFKSCEVLVTFMVGFARRFLDELREEALDALFGGSEWKAARSLAGSARTSFLVDLYGRQLKSVAGAVYVRSFEMRDPRDEVLYHLFFATKHPLGFIQMKEAMYTVARDGSYRFSDVTDPAQRTLLDYANDVTPTWVDAASDAVHAKFGGSTVAAGVVKRFIEESTGFVYRAPILNRMVRDGRVASVDRHGRRGGGYGEADSLTFTVPPQSAA